MDSDLLKIFLAALGAAVPWYVAVFGVPAVIMVLVFAVLSITLTLTPTKM